MKKDLAAPSGQALAADPIRQAIVALEHILSWVGDEEPKPAYVVEAENALSALLTHDQQTRDARRYRWLRDRGQNFVHKNGEPSPWAVIGTDYNDAHPCSWSDLDAAIDAAMEAETLERTFASQ